MTLGFLNLNKPPGTTSHDCVAKVRRLLKLKRVGHGGTLDPSATGVLPLGLGKATKLLQFLPSDKAYRGIVRFGITTTTDDLEGEILTQTPAPDLSLAAIETQLPQFLGQVLQIPPSYSAIHVDGKRLYELARQGQIVEAPTRTVEIFQLTVLNWWPGEFPELELEIACGAGTYIRSIARDLGAILGVGGTLAKLIRTQSGGFSLTESLTLDALTQQVESGIFQPIPPHTALKLPVAILDPEQVKRWQQGQRLPYSIIADSPLQVQDENGIFLGIGQLIAGETSPILAPQVVF